MEGNRPAFPNLQAITDRMQKIRQCIQQERISEISATSTLATQMQLQMARKMNRRGELYQNSFPGQRTEWRDFRDWNDYPDFRTFSSLK